MQLSVAKNKKNDKNEFQEGNSLFSERIHSSQMVEVKQNGLLKPRKSTRVPSSCQVWAQILENL